MRKLFWIATLTIGIGLLLGPVLEAAVQHHHVVIQGHGALVAKGAGMAHIFGDGKIMIAGQGAGVVFVKGAEALKAEGHGVRRPERGGVLFAGWKGQIMATGKKMLVRIEGGLIEFRAEGKGRALLVGIGSYEIGKQTGHWLKDGLVIEYQP
jgi:hypothetical protein